MNKLLRIVSGTKKEHFFICSILALFLVLSASSSTVQAQDPPDPPEPNTYFQVETMETDGKSLSKVIINGPPEPLPGIHRETVSLPEPDVASGLATLTVPAYNWSFGCSATSAAMIAAYYDRNSFANMYTGPTNGGVMPLNNSSWPDVDINSETRHQCPLSATRNGLDGRASRGNVDDYWISYDATGPDPYVTNLWTEHTLGDCTADYMKTSRWADYSNRDGATTFWYFNDGSPIYAADLVSYASHNSDGGYGLKLFYESRGYTVTTMYNQKIEGYQGPPATTPGKGYTFSQYQAEINAGRPVMIHVEGHTMVGVGYDSSSNLVYLHDTWDYSTHTMTWGGSYQGMKHLGVTIVHLSGGSLPPPVVTSSFPWIMYQNAFTGGGGGSAPPPPPAANEAYWGVNNTVCCTTSSATFSLALGNLGNATKQSTLASCSSQPTWEDWATTTPGPKNFIWELASTGCGTANGPYSHTMTKNLYHLYELGYNGADFTMTAYVGTPDSPVAQSTASDQKQFTLVDEIPLSISNQKKGLPKGVFKATN